MRRLSARPWLRILLLVSCVAIGLLGLYRFAYIDHFSMAARAVGSIPLGASTEELGLDAVPFTINTTTDWSATTRLAAATARRRLGGRPVSDLRSGGVRNLALSYTDGSRATLVFKARDEMGTRRRWIISPGYFSGGITGWRESEPSSPPNVGDPYLRPALNRWKPPKYTPPKFTVPKYKLPKLTPRTYTPGVRRSVTETYTVTVWRYETSRIGLWFEPPDEGGLPDWP